VTSFAVKPYPEKTKNKQKNNKKNVVSFPFDVYKKYPVFPLPFDLVS